MNKSSDITVDICLLVKDENEYLEEWVHHYEILGVSKIYIYDDRSDPPVNINNTNIDIEIIKMSPKSIGSYDAGANFQIDVYNDCLSRSKSTWIGFFDTDEFVVLENHKNIPELLMQYSQYPVLALSWKLFGPCNMLHKPENVLSSFLYREKQPSTCYTKIFVQVKSNSKFTVKDGCHWISGKTYMTDNKLATYPDTPCLWDIAYINHYRYKSFDEFIYKIKRNVKLWGNVAFTCFLGISTLMEVNEKCVIYDDRILQLHYPLFHYPLFLQKDDQLTDKKKDLSSANDEVNLNNKYPLVMIPDYSLKEYMQNIKDLIN